MKSQSADARLVRSSAQDVVIVATSIPPSMKTSPCAKLISSRMP